MENFSDIINRALESVNYPKQPLGLYEPVSYTLSAGGKRLRPALLLLTHSLYSDKLSEALPATLALETYHNYTLVHDDVMDNADVRRGLPTVHRKWDTNTAILSGDVMLVIAVRHLEECNCSRKDEVRQLFLQTMTEVFEGQRYDLNFECRDDVSVDEYLEMIRLKTSVLVACAAKMGALIADAPDTDCDLLYAFAEKVGLAFQLQDDFLDVYGDPKVFGKRIGGDILCGKKTYLLTTALATASEQQRERLLLLINNKEMSDDRKIADVTAIYNELNIPAACKEAIAAYYDEARNLYETLALPEAVKAPLWQWAEELLNRRK